MVIFFAVFLNHVETCELLLQKIANSSFSLVMAINLCVKSNYPEGKDTVDLQIIELHLKWGTLTHVNQINYSFSFCRKIHQGYRFDETFVALWTRGQSIEWTLWTWFQLCYVWRHSISSSLQVWFYWWHKTFTRKWHISRNLSKFYDHELEAMKNCVIVWNPRTTLQNMLFMSRNSTVRYYAAVRIWRKYLINAAAIWDRVPVLWQRRRAKHRKRITINAKPNLVFGESVLNVCSDMTFKYLTEGQLKKFSIQKFEH